MKYPLILLFWALSFGIWAQAPQSIPYQAVVRSTDGSTMDNAAVTITFKIHDNSATGTVVYEETHATNTNEQGLVSLNVGGGTAVTGAFSGIQWGTGSKFLQVLMNAGNGVVDLGTQQMMSVPYALYAEEVPVRVSVTGDSLFIGDQVSIVPGVSAANAIPGCTNSLACNFNPSATLDNGSCLILGNACDDGNANTFNDLVNAQCQCAGNALINGLYYIGNGVTDVDGNFYPSIVINGQEWMQKNLAVSKYRNGNPISTGLTNTQWQNTTTGAYSIYSDQAANNTTYGKLYNWYAMTDSRGVCPTGWHVPSEPEWFVLENYLGGIFEAGAKMKTTTGWTAPNSGATNSSGFTGLPGGYRLVNGTYNHLVSYGYFWTTTPYEPDPNFTWYHALKFDDTIIFRSQFLKRAGMSIRCLKD
jgi:uncharacterized protein (TIGR02145 family)